MQTLGYIEGEAGGWRRARGHRELQIDSKQTNFRDEKCTHAV